MLAFWLAVFRLFFAFWRPAFHARCVRVQDCTCINIKFGARASKLFMFPLTLLTIPPPCLILARVDNILGYATVGVVQHNEFAFNIPRIRGRSLRGSL